MTLPGAWTYTNPEPSVGVGYPDVRPPWSVTCSKRGLVTGKTRLLSVPRILCSRVRRYWCNPWWELPCRQPP